MAQSPYAQIIQALFQDGVEPADLDQLEGMLDNVRAGTVGTNLTGVATDPTYRSGFDYAKSIAGGMPFEQVVAPGMSFSPDRPMGYTQADLTPPFYSSGLVPVKPVAPTKDEPLVMENQMPYAPPGTPEPTIFGQQPTQEVTNLFQGIDREALADKIADLNLFNFEDLDFTSFPGFGTGRDFPAPEGSEGPAFVVNPDGTGLMMPPPPPSLEGRYDGLRPPPGGFDGKDDGTYRRKIDEALASGTFEFGGGQQPSTTVRQPLGDIRDTYTPEQVAELERRERERQAISEANIIAKYGSRENLQNQIDAALGTNLVMPIDLEPRIPVKQPPPVIPNIPVFTPPPVPSLLAQPRVNIDDIVSPISAGRITRRTPNLFNIV